MRADNFSGRGYGVSRPAKYLIDNTASADIVMLSLFDADLNHTTTGTLYPPHFLARVLLSLLLRRR